MSDLSKVSTEELLAMLGQGAQPEAPQRQLAQQPAPNTNSRPWDQLLPRLAGLAQSFASGVSLNQGNKLDALLGFGDPTKMPPMTGSYSDRLGSLKTRDAAIPPEVREVGQTLGVIANPLTRVVGAGMDAMLPPTESGIAGGLARYGNRVGQGVINGAAYGAGFAPEGQAKQGAVKGAIGGGATAGALQLGSDLAGPLLSKMIGPDMRTPEAPAMTQEQIKGASQKAYQDAEKAGVVIAPESFSKFADELSGLKGFHPTITPGTNTIINALKDEAKKGPITLETLDGLRSVVSGASVGRDNEARLAGGIVRKIDDYIDGLKGADLISGDAPAAADALKNARQLWRTNAKMQNINNIVETGENLNDPNWVKNQFRAIIRKPAKFDQYTPDEQKIITEVARTGNLERVARLVPWRAVQTAAPFATQLGQDLKLGSLQDLIARGGIKPKTPPMFGAGPPGYLSGYGGLLTEKALPSRPATVRK